MDWKALEDALYGVYASAKLQADGYEITIRKGLSKNRVVAEVWVNGQFKGEWYKVDEQGQPVHPEGRFWYPCKNRTFPVKEYKNLKSLFGKAEADKLTALRVTCVLPLFPSEKAVVRHFKKHFPDAVWLDAGGAV